MVLFLLTHLYNSNMVSLYFVQTSKRNHRLVLMPNLVYLGKKSKNYDRPKTLKTENLGSRTHHTGMFLCMVTTIYTGRNGVSSCLDLVWQVFFERTSSQRRSEQGPSGKCSWPLVLKFWKCRSKVTHFTGFCHQIPKAKMVKVVEMCYLFRTSQVFALRKWPGWQQRAAIDLFFIWSFRNLWWFVLVIF